MAKKDNENFDFDTESESRGKFDLAGFFKNLTKQQKGIILIALVAVVLVIAIVITCVAIGANGGLGNTNGGGNNNSGNNIADGIVSISVSAKPTKEVYYVGEQPDYSGLVLMVTDSNDNSNFISYDSNPDLFKFSGFDSSTVVEEQQIMLEFMSKYASFTIKVIEAPEVPPRSAEYSS